jgi:hypothetical protein
MDLPGAKGRVLIWQGATMSFPPFRLSAVEAYNVDQRANTHTFYFSPSQADRDHSDLSVVLRPHDETQQESASSLNPVSFREWLGGNERRYSNDDDWVFQRDLDRDAIKIRPPNGELFSVDSAALERAFKAAMPLEV